MLQLLCTSASAGHQVKHKHRLTSAVLLHAPAGLPKASTAADDDSWNALDYLKVPLEDVKGAFERYGLLDEQVHFHRGLFRDSLPPLRSEIQSRGGAIALLRMGAAALPASIPIFPCMCAWQQSRPPSTAQLGHQALHACHARVLHCHKKCKVHRGCALATDGDMYESTMDILFNLADLLSPGACVVVDDW